MRKAVVYFVVPAALIALFLYVRRRTTGNRYLLFTIPFLVAALSTWFLSHDIMFYDYGPRLAEGFRTWAISAAVCAVALVCPPRINNRYAVGGQAGAAFLLANMLMLSASWTA